MTVPFFCGQVTGGITGDCILFRAAYLDTKGTAQATVTKRQKYVM